MLESIVSKILGPQGQPHSYRIHAYKGIGRLPKDLRGTTDADKRVLLDRLPRIIRGYGASLRGISAAVVVLVDLDDKDCQVFKRELLAVCRACCPSPRVLFRIAIEEGEAWLLGDRCAVKRGYPAAKDVTLRSYVQDSICGTWEVLADAVYPGGSAKLAKLGWPHTGNAKCEWAGRIAHHIDTEANRSKSFQVFRDGLRRLAGMAKS